MLPFSDLLYISSLMKINSLCFSKGNLDETHWKGYLKKPADAFTRNYYIPLTRLLLTYDWFWCFLEGFSSKSYVFQW